MFDYIVNNLIDNNVNINNNIIEIDLILEGGAFNGAYMLGSLKYIKQLERNKILKVNRISASSVGIILAILYYFDILDISFIYITKTYKYYKKYGNIKCIHNYVNEIFNIIIKKNIYFDLTDKLYVNYLDIKYGKEIINHKYNDIYELKDCLIRGCHVPTITSNSFTYNNRFIDAAFPYIFHDSPNLYIISLSNTPYKIYQMISITDKTYITRFYDGVVQANNFFNNKPSTIMSNVNKWNIYNIFLYRLKKIIFIIIFSLPYTINNVYDLLPYYIKNNLIINSIISFVNDIKYDIIKYMFI